MFSSNANNAEPEAASTRTVSRRVLLHRGASLGVALSGMSALLSACGAKSSVTASTAVGANPTPGTEQQANVLLVTPTPVRTPAPSPATDSVVGTAMAAARQGGTATQGTTADAVTMNPVLASDRVSTDVVALMFNAVMRADPATTEPRGDLAKSWGISPDGLTYTFHLNDSVMWHDGSPLTARDVKFTYELHLNSASGSPNTIALADRLSTVDAPDDQTVVFTLFTPASPFLVSNMTYRIVPMHILQNVAPKALAQHAFSTGTTGTTIGSGPFQFQEWVKGDHITLTKFLNYWRGTPNLDEFVFKVLSDSVTVMQQLIDAQIDYTGRDGVDATSVNALQQQPVDVVAYESFNFTYYGYQLDATKSDLFQDKAVRQALFYALDRDQMIAAVHYGFAEKAIGTMSPLSWAYAPGNIANTYPYNPDLANKLLDDAGWVKGSDGIRANNGVKLSFNLYTNTGNDAHIEYTQIMQQSWKLIGVDCTAVQEDWTSLLPRLTKTFDFDMFLIGFSWGIDPDQTNMWATGAYRVGFNVNKYSNPRVDDLLHQGLIETSIPTRAQIYAEMQNLVLDDLPSAILDFPKSFAAHSRRIHNLFPNAVDDRWNAEQWWVDA